MFTQLEEGCEWPYQVATPKTAVLLRSASDWDYGLTLPVHEGIPPIEKFLDSMAGYCLKMSDEGHQSKSLLAGYIFAMLYYCHHLKGSRGPVVKSPSFATRLRPEHRELHYELSTADPGQRIHDFGRPSSISRHALPPDQRGESCRPICIPPSGSHPYLQSIRR